MFYVLQEIEILGNVFNGYDLTDVTNIHTIYLLLNYPKGCFHEQPFSTNEMATP